MGGSMKLFWLAATLCLSTTSTVAAQERSFNPNAQSILRTWPAVGDWQVGLVRLVDGGFGCLLFTGKIDQLSGERYFWGLRWRAEGVAAIIVDNNQQAVDGSSIQINIDLIPIGKYEITRRNTANGFQAIAANIPDAEKDRFLGLISVGGTMQFVTQSSTYTAPLKGAQAAASNLKACTTEATHLSLKSQ